VRSRRGQTYVRVVDGRSDLWPRKAESNGVGVRQATSQKAREVPHPRQVEMPVGFGHLHTDPGRTRSVAKRTGFAQVQDIVHAPFLSPRFQQRSETYYDYTNYCEVNPPPPSLPVWINALASDPSRDFRGECPSSAGFLQWNVQRKPVFVCAPPGE